MKADITVRDAVPSDSALVAHLIQQLGYPNPVDIIAARMRSVTENGNGRVLVADDNGRVIAVATLYHIRTIHRPGDICRITAFVVDENVRGGGIGRQLVAAIEQHARDAGCARVEVTSAGQRTGAHAFYLSLGYTDYPKRFIKDL
jgi:GNAT superfamily N-acetyltransferase